MNKYIAVGHICKDIEVRYTSNQKPVISNSIAVRNDFKNSKGEYDSEFVNIVAWNSQAEYLSKYAKKGDKLLVEGRLTNRSYDKTDGTKGYTTEIICDKVELLGSKKENQDGQAVEKQEPQQESDPYNNFQSENQEVLEDLDDSLPF